jgi:hypothetical protein
MEEGGTKRLEVTGKAQEAAHDGQNFRLLSPIRSDPSSCSASLPRLSPASSLSSDSGGSVQGRLNKRRRGRPSKKGAHHDSPAEDPKSRGGLEEPPPPIPILKLRIPKALFQNTGETGVSWSDYRRVAVRKERLLPRPSPRRRPVQNRLAQQLRTLHRVHCKVDVQKFRFKVGYVWLKIKFRR